MKCTFEIADKLHTSIWSRITLTPEQLARVGEYIASKKPGKKMEIIIREAPDWTTDQMKKYFEGPVVSFVQDCYAHRGIALGEGVIREGLKAKFIGWTEPNVFGQRFALSRTELDKPKDGKSSRERWIKFLKDISDYCKDEFHLELPSADDSDIGD